MPIFPPPHRSILLALSLLSACAAAEVTTSGIASTDKPRVAITGATGDYLGGRFAAAEGDISKAATLFLQGLEKDPESADLQQRAFVSALLAHRPEAVTLARQMPNNPTAQLLLGNEDAQAGRWSSAENRFSATLRQGPVQLILPLLLAWSQQGAGQTDAALATLKPFVEGQRFRGGYALHAALIADLAGHDAEAARLYRIAQTESGGLNLQLARMLASWHVRQGRILEATQVFEGVQEGAGDIAISIPAMYAASARRIVTSPTEGMAEAYLALAGALRAQDSNDLALVMLQLALDLEPGCTVARLLAADILDSSKHPDSALAMLKPVSNDDALISAVHIRQAALSEKIGDHDAALKLLDIVAQANPARAEPLALRGDILRAQKRFPEAVAAYDAAIAKIGTPSKASWPLFYERGIALERSQNWDRAEADFQHALQLSPDEPFVLNYLGYSWTEQGRNLPKARQMIQRAVDQRPNDGSIIDSLGWVALRQGDVKEAVKLLQRAAELEPADPTVNLHLGDAFWAAGRKLEAQFQWRRSLTLSPEPEDVPKLEAKLRESEIALGNLPAPTKP